jgi:hypothetical protein
MGGNAFGCVGWAILIFAYWLLVKDRTPINDRQYRLRLNAMSQNAKKQAAINRHNTGTPQFHHVKTAK